MDLNQLKVVENKSQLTGKKSSSGRKKGRPITPEEKKRKKPITVYFTEEEYIRIEKQVMFENTNISQFARDRLLKG